jgi:hypothetical protein
MAAIAGLRGTGDWGTDERPKNFREMILFRNPNGGTPLTALMARTGSQSVDDPEFSWWDEPVDMVRLQVAGALAAGDTTVTVDSADPSSTAPANNWGVANHLKAGDLLLVEPAADNATFDHEVIEVDTVLSATQFTVKRGASGTTAATIANDLFLLLIGNAYEEGTPSPSATSRNPVKYSNFTQIFKDTYELTGTVMQTRARTGDVLQNDKKRKMWDHARGQEFAMLFGQKSETTGPNGKPLRTTAGLRAQIAAQNVTIFAGAPDTTNTFLDAVYKVFDYESPAGDTRIALCGNVFLNELNKIVKADSAAQMAFGDTITQFGMNLRRFIMPQGELFFRTHPLLNRHSLYQNSCWIIDFSSLKWRPMRGRDTKFKDNIQNNDEDTRKGQWMTEGGLEVSRAGLTCGYLGSLSST